MREIGIRQGRLSPSAAGSIPGFPWESWKDEFALARRCGFDTIEWLFAAADYERNPIWTTRGHEEIVARIVDTGVRIGSICADFFMTHRFFRVPDEERSESVRILERLVVLASRFDIGIVIVPVLEASEIRQVAEAELLFDSLSHPLKLARTEDVRLAIETDLPAAELRWLIDQRQHEALGVCYDTGNAAHRGSDVAVDVRALAPYLCEVHIKDRKRNGPSVALRQGVADFPAFFRAAARHSIPRAADPRNTRQPATGRHGCLEPGFLEAGGSRRSSPLTRSLHLGIQRMRVGSPGIGSIGQIKLDRGSAGPGRKFSIW